jgi:hypothetical protein
MNFNNDAGFEFEGELDTATNRFRVTNWSSVQVAGGDCCTDKNYLSMNLNSIDGPDQIPGNADDQNIFFVARQMGTGLGLSASNNRTTPNFSLSTLPQTTTGIEDSLGTSWFLVSEQTMADLPWVLPEGLPDGVPANYPIVWGANSTGTTARGASTLDRLPGVAYDPTTGQPLHLNMIRTCEGGLIVQSLAPIPEPSAALMVTASLLGIFRRRRSANAA